jgi:hypothetical protein
MALNPSNLIAKNDNPDKTVFPNLARHLPDDPAERQRIFDEVDAACKAELEQAGIKIESHEFLRTQRTEVPTQHIGTLCQWSFRRAWYYWVAVGPGIPCDLATEFHETWGTQCRVDGHCGCPSPREMCHGFAIGSYHVDTQAGLNALAELLRSIYDQPSSSARFNAMREINKDLGLRARRAGRRTSDPARLQRRCRQPSHYPNQENSLRPARVLWFPGDRLNARNTACSTSQDRARPGRPD